MNANGPVLQQDDPARLNGPIPKLGDTAVDFVAALVNMRCGGLGKQFRPAKSRESRVSLQKGQRLYLRPKTPEAAVKGKTEPARDPPKPWLLAIGLDSNGLTLRVKPQDQTTQLEAPFPLQIIQPDMLPTLFAVNQGGFTFNAAGRIVNVDLDAVTVDLVLDEGVEVTDPPAPPPRPGSAPVRRTKTT
jgi:hypothetical protein